jgi:ATP-dependent exoDNAse (exonuclease V) alpha subunit
MKQLQLTLSQTIIFNNIISQLDKIIKTGMVWDNIVSLRGAAGTGKTFLTTKIVRKLQSKYQITITAPTHKALKVLRNNLEDEGISNITTKTIQSFLKIELITDYDKGIQRFQPKKMNKTEKSYADILIVDESSMVSEDLYSYIKEAIEENRVKAVLFIGDIYQLLPQDSNENKIFNVVNQHKLTEIVRQVKDSYIIQVSTKVRDIIKSHKYIPFTKFFNENTDKRVKFFNNLEEFHNDFSKNNNWSNEDKVITSFTNKTVDYHNRFLRKQYWKEQGKQNIPTLLVGDELIFQNANVIEENIIHQNSDIIKLKYCQRYFHEALKIYYWDCKDEENKPFKTVDIESYAQYNNSLNLLAKSAKEEQNYHKRKEKWRLFFNIKETFSNLKYTFASTIHKLQGSTYKTVYIDLTDIEKILKSDGNTLFRLLYVAITRASEDIKILLPNFNNQKKDINFLLADIQNNNILSFQNDFDKLGMKFN